MNVESVIGWDIGGAHLKAAAINNKHAVTQLALEPMPLWQGMDQLEKSLKTVLRGFASQNAVHVITMTGELVDVFATRDEGVQSILQMVSSLLGHDILVYAGQHTLLKLSEIDSSHIDRIASMNWLASASLAAQHIEQGLFVDIGSTTTDVLALKNSRVEAVGYTDYQRLIAGELLYTGLTRTSVMAVAHQARFKGQTMELMTEHFATMADVYRVTGELTESHDCYAAADGGAKTREASAIRLSRLTGYDFSEKDWTLWHDFASGLKQIQLQKIKQKCLTLLDNYGDRQAVSVVGAGIGRFLVKQIAEQCDYPYIDFDDIIDSQYAGNELTSADCAPAVAVAYLGAIKAASKWCNNRL